MDLEYFLKVRTKFIRNFYSTASQPFTEIKHKIDNQLDPYEYDEKGALEEPPFLEEWLEADAGIQAVGQACISMLSSAQELFLKSWLARFNQDQPAFKMNSNIRGWFKRSIKVLENMGLDLGESGANMQVIEQIILARNRVQHPEHLTSSRISHSPSDLEKFPSPYFVEDEHFYKSGEDDEGVISWWTNPPIGLTEEKLFQAIKEVEQLSSWLENEYVEWRWS